MGAAGQRLGLRLFLEGQEVPIIAAQIQIGINAPATAAIQIVPGDRVLELRARTMVHLFFWDYTLDHIPAIDPTDPEQVALHYGVSVEEAKDLIANRPDILAQEFDELKGYKLLFTGEVIGISMAKSPLGRQAVLQCADFSTYWDTTYQFFVSYGPQGNFLGTSSAVWAGGESMFDDITNGHTSVMNEYLRDTPKTPGLQNVKGLMGGIISLLEAMGGVPRHTHGVNDFFTIAELKNHILQQIVCEQNDDTSLQLFGAKAFSDWLSRGMTSLGSLSTFRDMMKLLFKYVYYEVVPNPAAMYVPSNEARTVYKNTKISDLRKTLPGPLKDQLLTLRSRALSYMRANYHQITPKETELAKSFSQEVKAIQEAADLPSHYKPHLERIQLHLGKIQDNPSPQINSSTTSIGTFTQTAREDPRSFIENRGVWSDVFDAIGKAVNTQNPSVPRNIRVKQKIGAELDRLQTQIFRPDCFFVAPPKCNVIFPDQYTQFSFSRNFLQEITRLRLHEAWEFGINEGLLETNIHFAPAMKEIRDLAKKQGNNSVRALLPWEIYSGILPKFETVHEVNYVAARSERKLGISKGNIKGHAHDYAQRVSNFNYMKYRFAARSCSVALKFNPFVVCGFPAALIERPFIVDPEAAVAVRNALDTSTKEDTSEFVRAAAKLLGAPSQYLGMVAAVGHNVDQSSGSTSLSLTHARTHRINEDDFLGVFSKELTNQAETEVVQTEIRAEDAIAKGDWKLINILIGVTDQQMGQKLRDLLSEQGLEVEGEDDTTDLLTRPDGSPDLTSNPQTQRFAPLISAPTAIQQTVLTKTDEGSVVTLRGKVKKTRLKGTSKVVFEPETPGRGVKKGPNGGAILQVQLATDAAVQVTGIDLTSKSRQFQPVVKGQGTIEEFEIDPNTNKTKKNKNKKQQTFYMWSHVIIHEEVPLKRKLTKLLPVEEALRPPWFTPLYSNWFIGAEIYNKFFGCGSLVDLSLFTSDGEAVVFGTGRAQQEQVLAQLRDANGDHKKILQVLEKATASSISDIPDVETSLDVLAYIYGEVRRLGLDVHKFVHDYTTRPIATMEQVLGSRDLAYEVTGDTLKVLDGTPGFHSSAIADVGGQLRGLIDNPDLGLSRLKTSGKKSPLARDLDPRPGRLERVRAYLEEINGLLPGTTKIAGSKGALGVGVAG